MEPDTRHKLLEAGKKEFLAHGYQAASLRRICARAGVTTGALYFFFEGKEALFTEIVEEPLKEFQKLADQSVGIELNNPGAFTETEDRIIHFLLAHRDECILLLDKAEGTRYEDFRLNWQRRLEGIFGLFFNKYLKESANPGIIHLITSMRIHGYMELMHGDYSDEEARRLVKEMAVYADAGFSALIKMMNKEQ